MELSNIKNLKDELLKKVACNVEQAKDIYPVELVITIKSINNLLSLIDDKNMEDIFSIKFLNQIMREAKTANSIDAERFVISIKDLKQLLSDLEKESKESANIEIER